MIKEITIKIRVKTKEFTLLDNFSAEINHNIAKSINEFINSEKGIKAEVTIFKPNIQNIKK